MKRSELKQLIQEVISEEDNFFSDMDGGNASHKKSIANEEPQTRYDVHHPVMVVIEGDYESDEKYFFRTEDQAKTHFADLFKHVTPFTPHNSIKMYLIDKQLL